MSTLLRRLARAPLALVPAIAVALALTLTGCGNDEKEPAAAQGTAGAAFPVRIDHKYGTTEIPKKPARVVTLGLSDQDAVLALGARPIGAVDWFKERPYGKWPWTQRQWAGSPPAVVGERDDFSTEKIAALKPDLVIAQYSGMTKAQYDTLSKFAPVVAQPRGYDDYSAPWKAMSKVIGRALGEETRMNALIAAVDRRFAQVRGEHPEFARQTIAVGDSFKPGEYALFGPTDPKADFMKDLGFKLSERIAQVAGKSNAGLVGSERLDLVDLDRVVWLTGDPAAPARIKADKVYRTLDVVRKKGDLFVPYMEPPVGAAVSFDTVLSIPYAIDQIVPLLTKSNG